MKRSPNTEPLSQHERVMVAARRLTHCERELQRALAAARDALSALELMLDGGEGLIPPHGRQGQGIYAGRRAYKRDPMAPDWGDV